MEYFDCSSYMYSEICPENNHLKQFETGINYYSVVVDGDKEVWRG